LISVPVQAQVKLNTLLTSEGLNQEGFPATYQAEFSLSGDEGVQYYVSWAGEEKPRDVVVKWFTPKDKLISQLVLTDFSGGIVRDYISFSKRAKTQFFIPDRTGNYEICLYINNKLTAVTTFKVVN
jgi:hypothetical protein